MKPMNYKESDLVFENTHPVQSGTEGLIDIKKTGYSNNALIDEIMKTFKSGGDTNEDEKDLTVLKQKKLFDYLTEGRGFKPVQALAVIGNVMAESGLKEDVYGDQNTSYGIQQWHNERKDKLFSYAKKKGHDTPTFEDQMEFLADEYEGKTGYSNFLYKTRGKTRSGYYNYSKQEFEEAPSLRDAVVAWNQGAGRPHKSVIRNDARYKAALQAASNLGVEIEDGPSYYTEAGFDPDEIEVTETDVDTTNTDTPEDTMTNDEMKSWIESFGKNLVAEAFSAGKNSVKADPDEEESDRITLEEAAAREKAEEEKKRRSLISAFLPNIMLDIKGVTEVGE